MRRAAIASLLTLAPAVGFGQWTNRYPKLEGYSHHVYVEGFELPILAAGPTDPAPSPDGRQIAVSARGWIWLLDRETGVARRVTSGPAIDTRPAWHPDGGSLAFLRDDRASLAIWSLDLGSGEERLLFEDDSIVLDPAWDPEGERLYYSAGTAGDLDIWALAPATGEPERITRRRGLEVRPQPLPEGALAYLSKGRSSPDALVLRAADGSERTLRSESIASQAHPGAGRHGSALVLNWPAGDGEDGYRLLLLDPDSNDPIELTAARGLPLAPSFTPDGEEVIYTEADAGRAVPAAAGEHPGRAGPRDGGAGVGLRGAAGAGPDPDPPRGRDGGVPGAPRGARPGGPPGGRSGALPALRRRPRPHLLLLARSRRGRDARGPRGRGPDHRDARARRRPGQRVGPGGPRRDRRGGARLRDDLGSAGSRLPLGGPPLPT